MSDSSEINDFTTTQEEGVVVVGIGASAGGIQALKTFFEHLPEKTDMAYVVMLHLSPDHDCKLAEVYRQPLLCRLSRSPKS